MKVFFINAFLLSFFVSILIYSLGCTNYNNSEFQKKEYISSSKKEINRCTLNTNSVMQLSYENWIGLGDHIRPDSTKLSIEEIETIECLLLRSLQEWNQKAYEGLKVDLEARRYNRQYCSLIDNEGHRLVFMNAYCSTRTNASSGWVIVADGGACYFNALFDLTMLKTRHFSVNGEA
jgi:hypothetical protein